jgi:MinD-like ATPase involved in chromosome partitioning or flagellar assembly
MTLSVITAIADPRWEADLVAGLSRLDRVTVVRRCVDVADLVATASAGIARAVVVSADLRRLDREIVTRLDLIGVAVVGMLSAGDDESERTLRRLGISHLVFADLPAEDVAAELRSAVESLAAVRHRSSTVSGAPAAPAPAAKESRAVGATVAVWGPTGAPGRTTVAIGLAAELAASGAEVVLVDADVYGGTVAASLGVLDDAAGFATACRLANSGRLDEAALSGLAVRVGDRLRVLTGIARADRWDEIRPSAAVAVLAMATAIAPYVVVDCGFCLEEDEDLSYDTAAPRRNGATVATLRAADTVVAVGSGDPIGLQRFVRGLADLRAAVERVQPSVVVNRVRPRVAGSGDPKRQITDALRRYADATPTAFVPFDQPAMDAAVANAHTLVEAAPTSPARQALMELAAQLSDVSGRSEVATVASRRARWRRGRRLLR